MKDSATRALGSQGCEVLLAADVCSTAPTECHGWQLESVLTLPLASQRVQQISQRRCSGNGK